MGIPIPSSSKAVTGATSAGVLTLSAADVADLFPGTTAWLTLNDGSAQTHVKILSIPSTTTAIVGNADPVKGLNGFHSQSKNPIDVSAYNASATLCVECQVAPVDITYIKRHSA